MLAGIGVGSSGVLSGNASDAIAVVSAADASGAQIGTPAFFINGKFFAGALPFEEFQRRIDAALAAPAAH